MFSISVAVDGIVWITILCNVNEIVTNHLSTDKLEGKKIVWKTRPNSKNIPIKHIAKGWDNKPSENYFIELFRVSR